MFHNNCGFSRASRNPLRDDALLRGGIKPESEVFLLLSAGGRLRGRGSRGCSSVTSMVRIRS